MSDDESDRPRRLEDTTAAYLLSISSKLDEFKKAPGDASLVEEQEILVNNVFEEIKNRVASAACDKRTNSIIEQMVLVAELPVLLELMNKFSKYARFLALNRHSSHVLESVFSRTSYIFKYVGIADELEDEAIKSVVNIAAQLLDSSSMFLLMKDMCSSHVIRALICLLSGLPIIKEKKSKNSKHQHMNVLSISMEEILLPDLCYVNSSYSYSVPDEFHG